MTPLRETHPLLADEVGLGKTIEAGYVIRQVLIDKPTARVAVIAPDILRRQWQRELTERFFIRDFPRADVRISAHETSEKWADYHGFDLVVIDEAHRLVEVEDPASTPYAELAAAAHSVPRILLLSATPVVWHERAYLALLHLLDEDVYRWDDLKSFTRRVRTRMDLARAVFSMDASLEMFLPEAIENVEALIPDDPRFRDLAGAVLELLDDSTLVDESRRGELALRVEGMRAHVGETYRLHRRVIRNRRKNVLREADAVAIESYTVTGRQRPVKVIVSDAAVDAGHDLLLSWQSHIAKDLVDRNAEASAEVYGQALGVLASRTGGSPVDLVDTLRWRWNADEAAAQRAGLTADERAALRAAPLAVGEADLPIGDLERDETRGDAAIARTLRALAREHQRVLVFCGAGSLAHRLVGHLREVRDLNLGEHTAGTGAAECETQLGGWLTRGGLLIADDSAEDGLNLQQADAVVHVRLPSSPNRFEQRLGRVDRYDRSERRPARQIIMSSTDGEFTLLGAWAKLLVDGFGIFAESVSALQAGIERVQLGVWQDAVIHGPRGLLDAAGSVRSVLDDERRDVDTVDMLDAVYESTSGLRDIAAAMGEFETGWKAAQRAFTGYVGRDPGGLEMTLTESASVMRFGTGLNRSRGWRGSAG